MLEREMDIDSWRNSKGLYRYRAPRGLALDPLLNIIEHGDPPGPFRTLSTSTISSFTDTANAHYLRLSTRVVHLRKAEVQIIVV